MSKSLLTPLLLVCIGMVGLAPRTLAQSDQRASMQDTIADRYHLTVLGGPAWTLHASSDRVRRAGGVVVIRKPGLYGTLQRVDGASFAIRDDNPPQLYSGKKEQEIRAGEKFYVHSVFVGSDVVSLGLVSVGLIPTPTKAAQLWMNLSFFFPKPVLDRGDISSVYRVMDSWLLPEGAFQSGYAEAGGSAAAVVPTVAPAPPSNLQPGMEKAQVIASLGAPLKEASYGTKTWLTYPGMVVVLDNGKLVSVDQTAQPPAKVNVTSEPAGADVYVDGNFVGSTPSVLPLPPGSHKIEVKSAGYKEWSREIKTLSGGEITLRAVLEK